MHTRARHLIGAVYGLLEGYRALSPYGGHAPLVVSAVLETLLKGNVIPHTCVPRSAFGALASVGLGAVFYADVADRDVLIKDAISSFTLTTEGDEPLVYDAVELYQTVMAVCRKVLYMPKENLDPESFLERYFFSRLSPINLRAGLGIKSHFDYLRTTRPWVLTSEITLYRTWATSLRSLADFTTQPNHMKLYGLLKLIAQSHRSPDLVTQLASGSMVALVATVAGAKAAEWDLLKRVGDTRRQDPHGHLIYPRDGLFHLLHTFC
jgi:hypothetical protein